ncbi:MAG: toxin-antitoxin system HicB family antitoxin [Kiritimatiellae bacterium]|nr:toxin-antitoxin system HicB family antitoxin [Kiritimatiellia bacterium]
MSALNLRLPNSIHRHIRKISAQDGVSINQFIATAVSEKISALTTAELIESRASRAKKGAFRKVLDQVPDRPPIEGDSE